MIRNIFIGALAFTILTSGALSFVEIKTAQPAGVLIAQGDVDLGPFGPGTPPIDPPDLGGSGSGGTSGGDTRGGSGDTRGGSGDTRGGSGDTSGGSGDTYRSLENPLAVGDIQALFLLLLQFIVRIGFIVVTVALIWVGFLFVKAQGNPEELSKAKEALKWTLVGAVILLGAEAIAFAIQATINDIQDATR